MLSKICHQPQIFSYTCLEPQTFTESLALAADFFLVQFGTLILFRPPPWISGRYSRVSSLLQSASSPLFSLLFELSNFSEPLTEAYNLLLASSSDV